ncbi:MAG: hypothetical protein H0T60_09055, partial [Acidobacteria bacterium]|nr:hypothetical protein [Acidobacteriota bacterium]
MALIVETGTGIVGANSYVSVAGADAYFADRNELNWAGANATAADKEGFLIRAADFLNSFYMWRGEPFSYDQSMALPTLAFDGVPIPVRHAQIILAKQAVAGPLFSALGERLVTSIREKLEGVGESETQYERTNADEFGNVGSVVAAMLRPFTVLSGGIQT